MILDQQLCSITALRQLLESLKAKSSIGHIELAMGDNDIALVVRHLDKLSPGDVNQLKQFALSKQWQLYLQPTGSDSLHRVDGPHAAMRLHYLLD